MGLPEKKELDGLFNNLSKDQANQDDKGNGKNGGVIECLIM